MRLRMGKQTVEGQCLWFLGAFRSSISIKLSNYFKLSQAVDIHATLPYIWVGSNWLEQPTQTCRHSRNDGVYVYYCMCIVHIMDHCTYVRMNCQQPYGVALDKCYTQNQIETWLANNSIEKKKMCILCLNVGFQSRYAVVLEISNISYSSREPTTPLLSLVCLARASKCLCGDRVCVETSLSI